MAASLPEVPEARGCVSDQGANVAAARVCLKFRTAKCSRRCSDLRAHRVHACTHVHAADRSPLRVKGQDACFDTAEQPKPEAEAEPIPERRSRGCVQAATRYLQWNELLKRVYDLDSLLCPRCGGRLRFIAVITDHAVARGILKSLALPFEPPTVARARAPTLFDEPPPPDYDAA